MKYIYENRVVGGSMVYCFAKGCIKKGHYGIYDREEIFCSAHKEIGMSNIVSKRCENEGCQSLNPRFDIIGGKGRFCNAHKEVNMIDVKNKRCEAPGCEIINPIFDFKGGKGKFCFAHKEDNMIDIRTKRCESIGCQIIRPVFDIQGGKGRFCCKHKEDGMVDVKSKRCEYPGCQILNPSFDIKGGKGRFCSSHKEHIMIDIRSKKCENTNCEKRPSFDFKGRKGRFCSAHKMHGMIDVKTKRCEYAGCIILNPIFNTKGNKGRFCSTHKDSDMIDVKSKMCKNPECLKKVNYGKPGFQPTHCAEHRERGMIMKPNTKCRISSCKNMAIWGINWIPRHCEAHKTDDDANLVEHPCKSCGLLYILDNLQQCESCNPETFRRVKLAKQNALMDYLDSRGLTGFTTDTMIDGGECGKERPDRIYHFGDKIVVLECDEHQHRHITAICEETRMKNIGQLFAGLPVYFIRFNPDAYDHVNNKAQELIKKRHSLCGDLISQIQEGRVQLPSALVSVIYLYYDKWSSFAEEKWKIITPYN